MIRHVISQGGNTAFNAYIVGAMVGALVGKDGLENDMYSKVLSFDNS